MKKLLYLLSAIFMISILLTSCGVKTNAPDATRKSDTAFITQNTDSSLERIKEKNKIIVGINDSSLPFVFRDKTKSIVGFDIDMAKAVAEIMGVEIEFTIVDMNNIVSQLNSYNIDLIWSGVLITPEYEEKILLSKPYLENRQVFITLKKSKIDDLDDLAKKNIGFQTDKIAESVIYESISGSNLIRYNDVVSSIKDLEMGKIDAVVQDEIICNYYLNKRNKELFSILNLLEAHNDGFAVGARLEDKSLMMEIDTALQILKDNGTAKEISLKWFGVNVVK